MEMKSGWIAFFINSAGTICICGTGMEPAIYQNKKAALKATHGDVFGTCKTVPPHPVKIEWTVEE